MIRTKTKDFTLEQFVEFFWSKVDIRGPDDCWEWQAGCYAQGYGQLSWKGKYFSAHKFAYEITHGEIQQDHPTEYLLVLHKCDNPPCVNPNHLYLGTAQDNADDVKDETRWEVSRRKNARPAK